MVELAGQHALEIDAGVLDLLEQEVPPSLLDDDRQDERGLRPQHARHVGREYFAQLIAVLVHEGLVHQDDALEEFAPEVICCKAVLNPNDLLRLFALLAGVQVGQEMFADGRAESLQLAASVYVSC